MRRPSRPTVLRWTLSTALILLAWGLRAGPAGVAGALLLGRVGAGLASRALGDE